MQLWYHIRWLSLLGVLISLWSVGLPAPIAARPLLDPPPNVPNGQFPILPDHVLPPCPQSLYDAAIDASMLPAPDPSQPASCRAKRIELPVQAKSNLLAAARVAVEQGVGQEVIQGEGESAGVAQPNQVGGGGVAAGGTYAWALNRMTCLRSGSFCSSSSPGVTQAYFTVTTEEPTLSAAYTWTDFHYYNRVHFTHPAYLVPCNGQNVYQSISAGYARGGFFSSLLGNRLVTELYGYTSSGTATCAIYDSGIVTSGPGGFSMRIYRSGNNWLIDAWTGSWVRLNTLYSEWNVAAEIEAGQELWRSNQTTNFYPIVVQPNFIDKLQITGTSNTTLIPWNDNALAAPLKGISTTLIQGGQFSIMDATGGDYTAISSYRFNRSGS